MQRRPRTDVRMNAKSTRGPADAWRYVALLMNLCKLISASLICLVQTWSGVAAPRGSEADRALRLCTQLYGVTVDERRHLFALNDFYVLGLVFNARGKLVELNVSPKYFFEEAHPDWAEPDNFAFLSKGQYDKDDQGHTLYFGESR